MVLAMASNRHRREATAGQSGSLAMWPTMSALRSRHTLRIAEVGRPIGAKNKLTREHIVAAKELAAEYGDPLRDLYQKRNRWQLVYEEQMAKPSRRRNFKKLAEAEEKIRQYNNDILPYDRPKFTAINHSGSAAPVPTVIRAPAPIADSREWLEKYRPKTIEPKPELPFVSNVKSALATAEQLGLDDAQTIWNEAAKATNRKD
jgi:hypothetical protein